MRSLRQTRGGTTAASRRRPTATAVRVSRRPSHRHHTAVATAAAAADATPPPKIRAILFDCDGVLVSSEHLSRLVAQDVLRELYGVDAPYADFIEYGGRGEELFLRGPAERHGVASAAFDADRAKQRFLDLYVDRYASGPRAAELAYPGAAALVKALRSAGVRTGVASSAARRKLDANLQALVMTAAAADGGYGASSPAPSIDTFFDSVVAFEPPVTRTKPYPDLFLRAMELASQRVPAMHPPLQPSECVVVEDAASGVRAAKAAGMWCVGVATTHTQEELIAFGADAAARDVSELSVEALLGVGEGRQAAGAGGDD
jgi:beta-phosphoglucomutase-like phosphatase (HAD superfamily)